MARVKPLMEVLEGVTRFGRLTVLSEAPRIISPSGFAALAANVRCDCGTVQVVRAGCLKFGDTRSCGCLQRELTAVAIADRSRTHGQSGKSSRTVEYSTWGTMKRRCYSPDDEQYHRYGGRGIAVCDRWRDSFEAFYEDMGQRPPNADSIERNDVDGNYEPTNCRWATATEQARNRRNTIFVTIGHERRPMIEWAEMNGIPYQTAYRRMIKGWTDRDAVTVPVRRKARMV
jgi:hypothetical protein